MKTCLIIVDVQNDFLPGGSLVGQHAHDRHRGVIRECLKQAVPDGDEVVDAINKVREANSFDLVVLTQVC